MEQAGAKDRAVSLEEAVSIAIRLQQNEQWSAAEDIYRRILDVAPDFAPAVHFSGVLAHQQAKSAEAVALIERSLDLEPDRADWYSNLGIVLRDRLKLDEAVVAFRRAMEIDPNHANATTILASCSGRELLDESEAVSRGDSHRSEHWTLQNLGILLNSQKRVHEAVVCFAR
jgi:tetratricopeptide (TPR) repeat protein